MNKFIRDLKRKKSKAQFQLFQEYSDYLYRICFRYMGNRDDAQDSLSKGFLSIYTKVAETDIDETIVLKGWMKKVVVNQCLMELRKRKLFYTELELIEDIEESPIYSDSHLLEEDLIRMVLTLPDGYRTVFCLYVIEGYKHEEIAEQLGVTVNTSKSQLRKARLQLQHMIENSDLVYNEELINRIK